jgi:hypothetical protein
VTRRAFANLEEKVGVLILGSQQILPDTVPGGELGSTNHFPFTGSASRASSPIAAAGPAPG